MRRNTIYGRLAAEQIEENAVAPGEEVAAEPVEAGADSLEAELIEVNDDIVEVAADEEIVEQTAEVVEEMEVAAESLRIIAQNGGLDKNGAVLLNLMQESWNRRIGMDDTHDTVSTESFGLTSSRTGATSLSAESIADKAKELWGKIVEMFRNALKAIVAVWNRIFDTATKMKARADKLVTAAGTAKTEGAGTDFEDQKLAENLHINGTVDVKAAAAAVEKEASVLEALSKHAISFANTAASAVEAGDANKVLEIAKAAASNLPGFTKVSDAATVGMAGAAEGMQMLRGEALPGNKAVIAIVPTDGAKPAAVGQTTYKLGTFDASKKVADKAKLKPLAASEVADVAKRISNAAALVLSYKPVQKEAEASAQKVIKAAEKKAKETKSEEGAAAGLSGADARSVAKGAMSLVTNMAPPLAAFALNAGGYCLQYGEKSLKAYGAKKEEKKAEAAGAAAAA